MSAVVKLYNYSDLTWLCAWTQNSGQSQDFQGESRKENVIT